MLSCDSRWSRPSRKSVADVEPTKRMPRSSRSAPTASLARAPKSSRGASSGVTSVSSASLVARAASPLGGHDGELVERQGPAHPGRQHEHQARRLSAFDLSEQALEGGDVAGSAEREGAGHRLAGLGPGASTSAS
jgi:hypothetical protein